MRCEGCGRLLGLLVELECPCWLSVKETGIVPSRLVSKTRRARRLREKKR